jgi:hypothetical protein
MVDIVTAAVRGFGSLGAVVSREPKLHRIRPCLY